MTFFRKSIIRYSAALCCFLVAWFLPEIVSFFKNRTYTKEQIDTMFESITAKYGIKIVYEIGGDFLSPLVDPAIPAGPARYSQVTPIQHRVLAKYPSLLLQAFGKYPEHVIKKYIDAIYFAGTINQNGFYYSGSYDPFRRVIYLVNNGRRNDERAVYTIHHEFSSLLLKSHSLLLNPWFDQNPKDFKYLAEIHDNWDDIKTTGKGTSQDYEKGFVTDYGRVTFENDFNEYAAMIFTYPRKFKQIMDQYPRVRGKFLVWLEFYQRIDPIFTEVYLFGENG